MMLMDEAYELYKDGELTRATIIDTIMYHTPGFLPLIRLAIIEGIHTEAYNRIPLALGVTHKVKVDSTNYDDDIEIMYWCAKNCEGKFGFRIVHKTKYCYFQKKNDKALCILKWSGESE